MTHTPGPWVAKNERVWNAEEVMYQAASNFDAINPSQTLQANAKLIAAAPEMLQALRDMLATYVDTTIPATFAATAAREAIAKATGE